MSNQKVDFSAYNQQLHLSVVAKVRYGIWLILSNFFFLTNIPYPIFFKVLLLKIFGATIGHNCIIKPWVKIKFPWKLKLGDNVWIGESSWIDNISDVSIGDNVCISQNAFLLTGNHDYTSISFDLLSKPITIENGVWICANAIIVGGVNLKSHSVVGLGQIITKDTQPYEIYGCKQSLVTRTRVIL